MAPGGPDWSRLANRSRSRGPRRGRTAPGPPGWLERASSAMLPPLRAGNGAFLYEGGFLLVALATAAVVVVDRTPSTADPLSRPCRGGPLRYTRPESHTGCTSTTGRSFCLSIRSGRDCTVTALLALRFGVTFVAAGLSSRFVEQPVRRGTLLAGHSSSGPSGHGDGVMVSAALPSLTLVLIVAVWRSPSHRVRGRTGIALSFRPARACAPRRGSAAHPERALLVGDSWRDLGSGLRSRRRGLGGHRRRPGRRGMRP